MQLLRSAFVLVLLVALTITNAPAQKSAAKSGSSLQTTIEKLEKDGWEAFKKQDDKAYIALCAPDYTAVIADNKPPRDAQAAAAVSHDIKVHTYSFSDFKVTPLGPEAAVATYISTVNATFGQGQPQDFKLAVTDLWVKHAGQWKALRYHESELK